MREKLTILFAPIDLKGHLNPMIGFGQMLIPDYHVVFAVSQNLKGSLEKYGFTEEIYQLDDLALSHIKSNLCELNFEKSPIQVMKDLINRDSRIKKTRAINSKLKPIIDKIQPDAVVVESLYIFPSAIKDQLWINLIASNPNSYLSDERSPPGCLGKNNEKLLTYPDLFKLKGLSANDRNLWEKYRKEMDKIMTPFIAKFFDWYKTEGLPKSEWPYQSPFLNVYNFPLELDYTDLRPNPLNWFRFDTFVIKTDQQFFVPQKLQNKSGKLIFFSLGSLISANLKLMKRLITMLSDSPHRFIVSKGTHGDDVILPDNCWGENYVPQTAVLKIVDLAILHGGNNSLCEAFYFGKPVIVMPVFADQFDNAQRVDEKGFGVRLDPFTCSKEQLLDAIENLLNDKELHQKMKSIAERCQTNSKSNQIVKIIDQIVLNSKNNNN